MCKSTQVRLNHTKRRVCNIRIWLISWLHNNFNHYIPFPYLPIQMAHINQHFGMPFLPILFGHHETISHGFLPWPTRAWWSSMNLSSFGLPVRWEIRGNPCTKWPFLVGGWPTPLKNMTSSVGIIIPNIWNHRKCSKPPSRFSMGISYMPCLNSSIFCLVFYIQKKTATNTNSIRDNATKPARKSGPVIQTLVVFPVSSGLVKSSCSLVTILW